MPRFSLIQLFMVTALVAIVLMFSQTNGCGGIRSSIEGLCFSADGTRMLVQRTTGREALTPDVSELMDVGRSLSWPDAQTGETLRIVQQEFLAGNQGASAKVMPQDCDSVVYCPESDVAITTSIKGDELTFYPPLLRSHFITETTQTFPSSQPPGPFPVWPTAGRMW